MVVYTLSQRVYDADSNSEIAVSVREIGIVNPCEDSDGKNISSGLCADNLPKLVSRIYEQGHRLGPGDRITSIPNEIRCVGCHTDYPINGSMFQKFEEEFKKQD
jgi:hypothetical protein